MTDTVEPTEASVSPARSGAALDKLALLEEERRFLLGSLRDLEREYEAGDVDEVDYHTLKDGYTVRAAAVLRQIDDGRARLAPKSERNWQRLIAIGLAMALCVAGIAFALASAFGERESGQELSGLDVRNDVSSTLVEARAALSRGDFALANELYASVDEREIEAGRESPEARAYVGWTFALLARAREESAQTVDRYELSYLIQEQAIEMDPTYADPYCFAAIIQHSFLGNSEAALPFIETCEGLDPPADMKALIEGFADEIRAGAG